MEIDGKSFGENCAEDLKIGDIVEWTKFNSEKETWVSNYGILIDIKNEIRSNRLVSISRVVPLNSVSDELEFFTMSLRRIDIDNQ